MGFEKIEQKHENMYHNDINCILKSLNTHEMHLISLAY